MEGHINNDSRSIVMEYLLHYCYKNTAKAFLKEMRLLDSCISPENKQDLLEETNVEWTTIDVRRDIQNAIQQGDIAKAFMLIELHFPSIAKVYTTPLESNRPPSRSHYVLHKLRCQQFIETLKSVGDMEAIEFAQRYIRPCFEYYKEYTETITALIAVKDLNNDTVKDGLSQDQKDLLSQNQRDSIADEVNEMILESRQTALEKLKRQHTIVQTELDGQKRQELLKNQKEAETLEKVSL